MMAARHWMVVSSSKRWPLSGKLKEFRGNVEILIDCSCSLFPKKVELQALIKYYDINGDGRVSYDEFLSGLR